jgi:hypothetical protein
MFSKHKTDYVYYNNHNRCRNKYFYTEQDLFIYEQLIKKNTKQLNAKYINDKNKPSPYRIRITIHSLSTKQYNKMNNDKINNGDDYNNQEYKNYVMLYERHQAEQEKIAASHEAYFKMFNYAYRKLLFKRTSVIITEHQKYCDSYNYLLEARRKQIVYSAKNYADWKHKDHRLLITINKFLNYSYSGNNDRKINKISKSICVKKMKRAIKALRNFIKIVYVKVVIYNLSYRIAINKILRSRIYNTGLGLKLNMRECGITIF